MLYIIVKYIMYYFILYTIVKYIYIYIVCISKTVDLFKMF